MKYLVTSIRKANFVPNYSPFSIQRAMKQLFLTFLFLLVVQVLPAQEVSSAEHLLFEGIEMKGDIYDFSKVLQKHGFKQKQRDLNQLFFVFKGDVLGRPEQFKVSFSKKSKTIWRIMVQPHNVPLDEIVDSLTARYGEPYEAIVTSYKWQLPSGCVLLDAHEGYDPNLVLIDAAGVSVFKDENNRN